MSVMLQYFIFIKIFFLIVVGLYIYNVCYKKYKFKSKLHNFISILMFFVIMIAPVKLQTETRQMQVNGNTSIEASKVLPDVVIDNSFDNKKVIEGISKEDMK